VSRLLVAFVVEVIAFLCAVFSALSFFTGQINTGLVTLVGAWLLMWWGKYALDHHG